MLILSFVGREHRTSGQIRTELPSIDLVRLNALTMSKSHQINLSLHLRSMIYLCQLMISAEPGVEVVPVVALDAAAAAAAAAVSVDYSLAI